MKLFYIVLVFLLGGCATSTKISSPEFIPHYATFESAEFTLVSKTDVFSKETVQILQEQGFVEQTGETLLRQIIPAYANQLNGIQYSEEKDAAVIFRVKKVIVKRSHLTLNFPHPGPIYKVILLAEIQENDGRVQVVKLQKKANMSEINYPTERFKRLTSAEKNDFENQKKALNTALRQLYQQLYFQYFDISLQL